MAGDDQHPKAPDFERVATLGRLGNRLIAAGCAITGVAVIVLLAAPSRSIVAALVAVALGACAVVQVFLARRDRDVVEWTRSYPSRLFGVNPGRDDAINYRPPSDAEVNSLLDLDEATVTALRAGRRYDLGLAFALLPGCLLIVFATRSYRPLQPGLQLLGVALFFFALPVFLVHGGILATRRRPWGQRANALGYSFGTAWLVLVLVSGAWALDGATDPGAGVRIDTRFAARYRDPERERSPSADIGDPYDADLHFSAPLHLAAVPGCPHGLTIYDPAFAWTASHDAGDPVRLVVGPGGLGVRMIRRVSFPATNEGAAASSGPGAR